MAYEIDGTGRVAPRLRNSAPPPPGRAVTVAPIPMQRPAALSAPTGPSQASVPTAAPPMPRQSMAPVAYAMQQYEEPGDPFTAAAMGMVNAMDAREQMVAEDAQAQQAAELLKDYPDLQAAVAHKTIDLASAIALGEKRDAKKMAEDRRAQIDAYLRASGDTDIADQFAQGVLDEDGVAAAIAAKDKPGPDTYTTLSAEEVKQLGLPPGSYQRSSDGKISQIGGGGVNVNVGQDGVDYGNPGEGLVWKRDPEGKVMLDERGAPVAIPYQGGKAYQQMVDAEEREAAGDQREDVKSNVVVQDIDRALTAITENPNWTTGVGAQLTGNIGGTPARNVEALISTVKANAGFKELQAMREASPTGGALGSITEREIAYLQATIGNLETSQSSEQLIDNLKRVKNAYLDIIHGEGNGPPREKLSFETGSSDAAPPEDLTQLSDEELLKRLGQ